VTTSCGTWKPQDLDEVFGHQGPTSVVRLAVLRVTRNENQIGRVFASDPWTTFAWVAWSGWVRITSVLPDLRKYEPDSEIERVQRQLDTQFDVTTEVRKRRSLGFRTDRSTWARIEIRDVARMDGQGWGVEDAALINGVSIPAWYQGMSWIDRALGVMWRVDETDLITDSAIRPGGIL
jgi:hypothetical protein